MCSAGSAPPLPDFANIIKAQNAADLNRAEANLYGQRVNMVTPYGRTVWYGPPNGAIDSYDAHTGVVTRRTDTGETIPVRYERPPWEEASQPNLTLSPRVNLPGRATRQTSSPTTSTSPSSPGKIIQDPDWVSQPTPPPPADTPPPPPSDESSKWTVPPVDPLRYGPWTVVQELSPAQLALLKGAERLGINRQALAGNLLQQAQEATASPLNTSAMMPGFERVSAPYERVSAPGYDGSARQRAEEALYSRATRYLNPEWQRREADLEQRLLAEGFNRNDPAFVRAMDQLAMERERDYASAREGAIAAGGREATDELNRALAAFSAQQSEANRVLPFAQFASSERDKALQDALTRINLTAGDRARALNELQQVSSGIQSPVGPTQPGLGPSPGLGGLDILGTAQNAYNAQVGDYSARAAQAAANNQAIASAIAAIISKIAFSDRRLKSDIKHVGYTPGGTKLYTWKWPDGSDGFGVMADEVPEAAYTIDGIWCVDYSKVK